MFKKRVFRSLLLAAVASLGLAAAAQAGTATASSTVTITYTGACSIGAGNPTMLFDGTADSTTSADLTINCTNGVAWSVTADGGLNASGGLRRGVKGSDFATYRVHSDAARTAEVAIGGVVGTGTGNGANQTLTAYFVTKTADNAGLAIGTYLDTLGWSLTF